MAPPSRLDQPLRDRVLERLGLACAPRPDLAGLRELYGAWCRSVPFDNVRKMIALRSADPAPLPGGDADDFLAAWLADGCGGTCWPSSNALWALLDSLGFPARRVACSMLDLGLINHGSVKVRLDGADWLADSSMLTGEPLPLGSELHLRHHPLLPAEVEPDAGTHVIWTDMPPNPEYLPCRVVTDPVDHAYYLRGYEASRERSAFNHRLYARVNRPGEIVVLLGHTRLSKTADGLRTSELSASDVVAALRDDVGLSSGLIERWVASGALDDSMQPQSGPSPPVPSRPRPSRRDASQAPPPAE